MEVRPYCLSSSGCLSPVADVAYDDDDDVDDARDVMEFATETTVFAVLARNVMVSIVLKRD